MLHERAPVGVARHPRVVEAQPTGDVVVVQPARQVCAVREQPPAVRCKRCEIEKLGFGTGRQRKALERGKNPTRSRRTRVVLGTGYSPGEGSRRA